VAKNEINFKPDGEVLRHFMLDDRFVRGIRGPVGSGKSVGCCIELFRRASQQEPNKQGIRKSRWAVVRNTNPQLKTTTIKTWLDWFPEETFGKFTWSVPYTHNVVLNDIEMEVVFLALDRPEDVRKLLSLDLTGVWVNEAREVAKTIIDACTMRAGRYPSMKDGGPTWYGVIMDTNAPEDDHWWPIMSGESPPPDYITPEERLTLVKPDDWMFYTQPPGMLEEKTDEGEVTGYELSPLAENYSNLPPSYYPRIITGKAKSWIDVYVLNKLGSVEDGKQVYPMFNEGTHVAKEHIELNPDLPVYIGIDFGLTPSAAFGQRGPTGRWYVFRELVATDMGALKFAEILRNEISMICPNNELKIYGDPAGDHRAQSNESTPFQMMRSQGIQAVPAPSNDPVVRIEAVQNVLNRMVDGKAGFLIASECKMLVKGFRSGYQYKRVGISGEARYEEKPSKNKYSHVADALQYMMIGAGEGREVLRGNKKGATVGNARPKHHNPFDGRAGFKRQRGWGQIGTR